MPGVFGIVGGDPVTRAARRDRMAAALSGVATGAEWPGAAIGAVVRTSDRSPALAEAGAWRVAIEGRVEGMGGAAELARALATGARVDLGGLDGWHTGAATDGQEVWLFTGFLGVEPLYVAIRPGEVVFAPEVKGVLAALPERPARDAAAAIDVVRFGHVLGTDTLVEGIRTLAPGTRLRVGRDGVAVEEPIAPAPPFAGDHSAWLVEAWPGLVARCLDRPGRVAGLLSGGLDSRVVLLPAPPGVPAITFGHADAVDVALARRLAAGMGRPHHVIPLPDDALLRCADEVVTRMDGLVNPVHTPGAVTNPVVAGLADHLAGGAFGDVLFGSRWRAVPDDADSVACLLATLELPPRAEGLLVDAPPALERLERHAGPGRGWREVIRQSFAHRVRRFTAAAVAERRFTTETLHPFYSRALFAAVDTLPVEERRDGAFYQRFVRDLAPALAGIPWARTGVPIGASREDAARVAAARRRERAWDRLLRNLRLGGRRDPMRPFDAGWVLRNHRPTREWARDRLATIDLPFVDRAAVGALVEEHMAGRRDHATLIGRLLALGG